MKQMSFCSHKQTLFRYAEGADFHGGGHHQRRFRCIADCIFLVHKATVDNGFIFRDNLVAVAAFQAHLIMVTFMRSIFHLLEIPYYTKLAHSSNQMAFLFPILGDLKKCAIISQLRAVVSRKLFQLVCALKRTCLKQ